jgi:hypothetical protein
MTGDNRRLSNEANKQANGLLCRLPVGGRLVGCEARECEAPWSTSESAPLVHPSVGRFMMDRSSCLVLLLVVFSLVFANPLSHAHHQFFPAPFLCIERRRIGSLGEREIEKLHHPQSPPQHCVVGEKHCATFFSFSIKQAALRRLAAANSNVMELYI